MSFSSFSACMDLFVIFQIAKKKISASGFSISEDESPDYLNKKKTWVLYRI